MVIDFDKYPVVAKPNFKGGNKEYLVQTFEDGDNRIQLAFTCMRRTARFTTYSRARPSLFMTMGARPCCPARHTTAPWATRTAS